MTIFRHKINQTLYTIEHLIQDIYHLNRNANAGIYAYPYLHSHSDPIVFLSQRSEMCEQFVNNNFKPISIR